MTAHIAWPQMQRGLVAILRGITPDEALAVAEVLIDTGFEALEVPLNSPEPCRSIEMIAAKFGNDALVGGGTMLTTDDVDSVRNAGGRLMVSPNMRMHVISHAAKHGMVTMPGVFSPSEAFDALDAGASGLKFFPASVMGPDGLAAMLPVFPKGTVVGAVGGVGADNMRDYIRAGITCFGLGTAVFRPGDSIEDVRRKAQALVTAYDEGMGCVTS